MKKVNLVKIICFFSVLLLIFTMGFTVMAEDEYTYESEFAKLPDEVKAMENIRFIDDHAEEVIQTNCATNNHGAHPYGDAWFTGESGASLTLEFEGTTIGLVVQKGAFEIYIDDEYIDTVWKASNPNGGSQLAYFNDSLENDIHTIQVVTDAETARENTPENYSVFHGFIVQDVVEPIPTPIPTEVPTQAPATEVPTTAPTTAPTQAPTEVPATEDPDVDDNTEDGNSKTLTIVFIALGALVVIAGVVLVVLKKKK